MVLCPSLLSTFGLWLNLLCGGGVWCHLISCYFSFHSLLVYYIWFYFDLILRHNKMARADKRENQLSLSAFQQKSKHFFYSFSLIFAAPAKKNVYKYWVLSFSCPAYLSCLWPLLFYFWNFSVLIHMVAWPVLQTSQRSWRKCFDFCLKSWD